MEGDDWGQGDLNQFTVGWVWERFHRFQRDMSVRNSGGIADCDQNDSLVVMVMVAVMAMTVKVLVMVMAWQ